jgi:hypothetical protein
VGVPIRRTSSPPGRSAPRRRPPGESGPCRRRRPARGPPGASESSCSASPYMGEVSVTRIPAAVAACTNSPCRPAAAAASSRRQVPSPTTGTLIRPLPRLLSSNPGASARSGPQRYHARTRSEGSQPGFAGTVLVAPAVRGRPGARAGRRPPGPTAVLPRGGREGRWHRRRGGSPHAGSQRLEEGSAQRRQRPASRLEPDAERSPRANQGDRVAARTRRDADGRAYLASAVRRGNRQRFFAIAWRGHSSSPRSRSCCRAAASSGGRPAAGRVLHPSRV